MRKVTVFVLAIMLVAPLVFSAGAREEPPASIRVGTVRAIASTRVAEKSSEFTEKTGIQVTVEQLTYPDLLTKIRIESVGNTGYYDIIRIGSGGIQGVSEPGWVLPLNDYIEKSGFDIDDWSQSLLDMVTDSDGNILAIPMDANIFMLAYRTDLFEDPDEKAAFKAKYGYDLAPPKTTDEWLEIAEFFTRDTTGDGENDLFGFGIGQRVPEHVYWPMYMGWTFGSELFDDDAIESRFNNEKTKAAFEWMLEMQKFQPPGILGVAYKEEEILFRQGKLAMAPIFFTMAMDVIDPEKSDVHDRVAFTTFPAAPGSGNEIGQMHLGGGTLSIHSQSRNPDAAWEFLAWLFSRETSMEMAKLGTVTPRNSLMGSEQLFEIVPEYGMFFPAYAAQLDKGMRLRPSVPESSAIIEQWGNAWHAVVQGQKSIDRAMADTCNEVTRILTEAGY